MSRGTLLTIADIDRMIARGEFDPPEEHRVELIRGELCKMSPPDADHIETVIRLQEWSYRVLDPSQYRVSVQNPVEIPQLDSMPEPDILWTQGHSGRPTVSDAVLLIEVSDSTIKFDTGAKSQLYAEAGVEDFWVVDVPGHQVHVFREPTETGYASHTTHGEAERITPLAVPDVALAIAELFARGWRDRR